jgi:hypothetical protein
MKPLRIHIEQDADILVEWSKQNENVLHETSMYAAEKMLSNLTIDEIVVIEFYEDAKSRYAFADITMHREDIPDSLQLAQYFFVEQEEYELALKTKNLQDLMNKNNKQTA